MSVSASEATAIPIHALHRLSEKHADSIVGGLVGVLDPSAVERHYSYDGHLYLILSHGTELTLFIDRDTNGMHIGFIQFDILQRCEPVHTSVASVILAITALVSDNNSAAKRRVA